MPAPPRTRVCWAPSVSALVELSRHGPVALIGLRREAKLNALSTARERALELADRLAALPPLAVSLTKRATAAAAESPRNAGLLIERLAYALLAQTDRR